MILEDSAAQTRSFWKECPRWIVPAALLGILILGAFLRFYHLGESGVNDYYAAAVKSMLLSWKNFFFAAFEPGGSVSVDKPPLGFWIEAVSAYFLGVNGFALALPNALAGVLSIFVVYKLVRRPFGPWAGLAAAAALAVMPVAVATERNNTIDGMLVFTLLLAAWAFLQSAYTGKARWLFLGAFIVGLGFNIKMLQAFMPLPAFYAVYFFGTKGQWRKKILYLVAATALLLVVSFSWAVAVNLTPAADRPYVDSTSSNSVLELIFGHNGIERLARGGGGVGPMANREGAGGQPFPGGNMPPMPNNQPGLQANPPASSNGQSFRPPFAGHALQPAGGPGSMDFGSAGTLRLFTAPLVGEASWLLPFALGGLIVIALALWKRPFGEAHTSAILWAGWLLPEMLYFSYSQGLMHAYYLIMLGPPIAALFGMALWGLRQIVDRQRLLGWILALSLVGGTLGFETYALLGQSSLSALALEIAGILFSLGLLATLTARPGTRFSVAGLGLLAAAMLAAPSLWSGLTTFNNSSFGLPAAGPARPLGMADGAFRARGNVGDGVFRAPMNFPGPRVTTGPGGVDQSLLKFLIAHTQPGTYLVATGRANSAAGYILATGRPVLAVGGFLDQYDEVSLDQIVSLIKGGRLRYVLGDAIDRHQAIAGWVKQNCSVVNPSLYGGNTGATFRNPGGPDGNSALYQCGS